MTNVAGISLDHVHDEPAQAHRRLPGVARTPTQLTETIASECFGDGCSRAPLPHTTVFAAAAGYLLGMLRISLSSRAMQLGGTAWHSAVRLTVPACQTGAMRMSAKAEYATRAMVHLATLDGAALIKSEDLAEAQGIPTQFLLDILSDLKGARLVRSHRGREGGYALARPAQEISLAEILRCIDGPLASVHNVGLGDLPYSGHTAKLTDVWMALRASMRHVLEETSLADVAGRSLPPHVRDLAAAYRRQERERTKRRAG